MQMFKSKFFTIKKSYFFNLNLDFLKKNIPLKSPNKCNSDQRYIRLKEKPYFKGSVQRDGLG